jgi:hypothetical protein
MEARAALLRPPEQVALVVYSRLLEQGASAQEASWMPVAQARTELAERSGSVEAPVWARLARQVQAPARMEAGEARAMRLVPPQHLAQKGPREAQEPAHSVEGVCGESALNPFRYGQSA